MHNKRPAPLAPSSLLVSAAKRARTRISDGASSKAAALDAFPTIEEIVHHIFSYLDAENLCTIQLVSKFWSRLASDNQLWKALFLREHPLDRLRGGKSSYTGNLRMQSAIPGREIKPLPHRASTNPGYIKQSYHHLSLLQQDYKWLYRIARNWQRGRCAQSRVFIPRSSSPRSRPLHAQPPTVPTPEARRRSDANSAQCVALVGPYIIIAAGPSIYLYKSDSPHHSNNPIPKNDSHGTIPATMLEGPSSNKVMIEVSSSDASDVTALAIDQSWPSLSTPGQHNRKRNTNTSSNHGARRHEGTIHVAAFHRSGHFDIFSVTLPHPYSQHHNEEVCVVSGGSPSVEDSEACTRSGSDPNERIWLNCAASSTRSGCSSGSNVAPEYGHTWAPGLASIDVKLVHSHPAPPSTRAYDVQMPLELDTSRSRVARMSNIRCATYHHPLLITLSQACHLLVYYIPDTSSQNSSTMATSPPLKPELVRSIHSYTSHPPLSMSLARVPTSSGANATHLTGASTAAGSRSRSEIATPSIGTLFKLVLAYTVPVYPAHWTAAAAEIAISVVQHHHPTDAGSRATTGQPDVRILSSRTASAMPTGWHEIPTVIASTISSSDDEDQTEEDEGGGEGDEVGEDETQAASGWVPSVPSTSVPTPTSSASALLSKPATVPSSSQNQGRSDVRNATPSRLAPPPHARRDGRDHKSHSTLPTHRVRSGIANAMEQWGRKIGNVVGTQTDGKWIVIAGNDNVLQVYRLHCPSSPGTPISISYSHSLHGHAAGIAALRVADGRCVSVGREGRLWVWDLEAGGSASGVSIGPSQRSSTTDSEGEIGVLESDTEAEELVFSSSWTGGAPPLVVFDERRVVMSLSREGVGIWHFDL